MISKSLDIYKCSNLQDPETAVFCCYQPNCQVNAFMCNRPTCTCFSHHKKHTTQQLGGIIEEILQPPILPTELAKVEKEVNSTFDNLIHKIEALKRNHINHIKEHISNFQRCTNVRRKLSHGEPLENKESTGNSFNELLAEMTNTDKIGSPYCL